MLSQENRSAVLIAAVGWVLVVLGTPLVAVSSAWLAGIPLAGLGLAAVLTGMLLAKGDQPGRSSTYGAGLLFLAVLAMALAAFDVLQLTAPLVEMHRLGVAETLGPGQGVRLLAEAFAIAALTAAGLMLRARWSALHATLLGLFNACTIPGVAAMVSTFASLGLPPG